MGERYLLTRFLDAPILLDDNEAADTHGVVALDAGKPSFEVMSNAICIEACPAPHFFDDAAYGILPSPYVVSGDEN
jgi:hypothetical protein